MASTAGNLLLRAGKITAEQLAAARALAHEKSYPLSEALVRGGAIDEPALVEFFARRLMIERLPPSRLHAIPKPVQRSVPPDMANEFRVVPIEFSSDGALVIAMADPTDTHAVDEVRFFTDRFVVRTVARLSEIYHALGVYYGADFAPLPAEDPGAPGELPIDGDAEYETEYGTSAAAAAEVEFEADAADDDEAAAPTVDPAAMATMIESPVLLTNVKSRSGEIVVQGLEEPPPPPSAALTDDEPRTDPMQLPMEPPATLSVELPMEPLRSEPKIDVNALVAKARAAASAAGATAPPKDEEPILLSRPIKKRRTTLTGASAHVPLSEIRAAESRDQVATLMLDWVALLCRRSLLMVIRRGQLVGFAARGDDAPRLAQLSLPLDAPTLLRDVIVSRLPYRGPLPITEENDRFADALGGVGSEVLVMPITIREKLIALLYADSPLKPLPDAELHAVTREVGLAFERLILEKRPG